ncbi:MAG: PilZ domain-containing protein, partial [Desulfobulbaceae bacterium]|nr:PilZ domain-containing protein [Desulfobulbaceae bacterium]
PEIGSATANPALCRMLVAFSSRLDRLLSVYSLPSSSRPPSPATVSLRQLLSEIDRKLLRLMESVHLPPAEAEVAVTPVSLSANGIKFATDEAYSQDDFVEIRLFLGGTNPCWLVACGRVVRVWGLPAGRREVAASFVDMDESIRQAIRTYGLQLQRDDLMRLRGWG